MNIHTILVGVSLYLMSALSMSKPLNDTGITYLGMFPKGNSEDCVADQYTSPAGDKRMSSDFFAQQDCAVASRRHTSLANKSVFSFQKVSASGSLLKEDSK